jgi:uncharacterized membrane protein YedE/YeeE
MLFHIIAGLVMGAVFGIALENGRVFEPGMMFLAATATTLVVVAVLTGLGWAKLGPKAADFPAVIFGGLLTGAGMALSGACPGTALAQIGAGYRDAWLVVLGGLLGALAYGYLDPALGALDHGPGKVTLADVTGIPFWLLALLVAIVLVLCLRALEKWRPWREDLGAECDGYFGEE